MSEQHSYPSVSPSPHGRPEPVIAQRTGMATAAFILGLLALLMSWIPGINFVTSIAAVVGLVLGLVAVGKGTSSKAMAWVGTVLSALALVVMMTVTVSLAVEISKVTGPGTVSGASSQQAPTPSPQAADAPQSPTFGSTYTWPNGLAVQVSTPKQCTPSSMSSASARTLLFTFTVTNGTGKDFNTVLLSSMDAQFDGAKAKTVVDFGGGTCGDEFLTSSTVLPGQSFTFSAAYGVGERPGRMQLTVQPDWLLDKQVFVGEV